MRIAAVVLGVAVLGFGAVWLTSGDSRDRGSRPKAPPVPITPRAAGPVGWKVVPGETVAISVAEIAGRGPVVIDLTLGEPSANDERLSGRILSLDPERQDRERAITGWIVGEDRGTARITIPSKWLREDRYLVEIKTTEKSHFPLRRYKIDVR